MSEVELFASCMLMIRRYHHAECIAVTAFLVNLDTVHGPLDYMCVFCYIGSMPDVLTQDQRSRIMASIHSRDTAPEVFFRKRLFARGYRYAVCPKKIPGKPDMWLRKWRAAIFVHGCFWHRHEGCRVANTPASRQDYWLPKFRRNVERDAETKAKLKAMGIRVLVVWECSVRKMMRKRLGVETEAEIMPKVEAFIRGNDNYIEI